jgi:hypothetical protein
VETLKPVDNVYWKTLSDDLPIINILVPSALNAIEVGLISCPLTLKETLSYDAVETLKPVDNVYWKTLSDDLPIINILVPSALNAIELGLASCPLTLKKTLSYDAVETLKPVDNVYWKTLSYVVPIINILVPSALNAIELGLASCPLTLKETLSYDAVETLKPVDNVYWKTLSDVVPIINILVPSALNAIELGLASCPLTLKETLSYDASLKSNPANTCR